MIGWRGKSGCAWAASLCVVAALGSAASGQVLQNLMPARSRVFPQVGPGIIAMKQDSDGRVYILATPPTAVLVFDANGNPAGRIPNDHSGGTVVHYAVDMDIDAEGDLLVADRGANAIDIFQQDGSLKSRIAVFAPTSVAALPGGQIAVTTLRTEHPVEVLDEEGTLVRGFGGAHAGAFGPAPAETPSAVLADLGRIVGDPEGHLYFAAVAPGSDDPEVRKFDRFGYVAYEAQLPTPAEDRVGSVADDRVQFSFRFTRLSRSEQVGTWTTIGDSGRMQFGSDVGMGLASIMGAGRGLGGPGGDGGSGMVTGAITGDGSLKDASLHLHLGMKASQRAGRGRGASPDGAKGYGTDQGRGGSPVLQYGASNYFNSDSDPDPSSYEDGEAGDALQFQADNSGDSAIPGALDYNSNFGQTGAAPGLGGYSGFFLGGIGPRPGGFERQFFGGNGLPDNHAGFPGAGAGDAEKPPFGGRGRYGASALDIASSVRINLDRKRPSLAVEKRITAMGVDRRTEELWAAMGSMLVHFDKDGNVMDVYYLATPNGAPISARTIVVDRDRLLVGAEALGVYEFALPNQNRVTGAKIVTQPTPNPLP